MANTIKPKKVKLSKGILEMKFMQKTKNKLAKENDDAEGRAMYSDQITDRMLLKQNNFITELSYVACEGLIKEGRFSFRGMNQEIERFIEMEANLKKRQEDRNKQKAEVSVEEMMKYYRDDSRTVSLNKNLGRKFRKHNSQNVNLNSSKNQRDKSPEKSKHKTTSAKQRNNQKPLEMYIAKNTKKFVKPYENSNNLMSSDSDDQ